MNLITVEYGQGQTYLVHENAIEDVILKVASSFEDVKISSQPRISFSKNQTNIYVYLDIKIAAKRISEADNIIKEITDEIDTQVEYLIDSKPKNTQICLLGTYN